MKALVYVESPYQLLNSISYLEGKQCRKTDFYIRDNGSTLQKKQFETIVNEYDLIVEYFSVQGKIMKTSYGIRDDVKSYFH